MAEKRWRLRVFQQDAYAVSVFGRHLTTHEVDLIRSFAEAIGAGRLIENGNWNWRQSTSERLTTINDRQVLLERVDP